MFTLQGTVHKIESEKVINEKLTVRWFVLKVNKKGSTFVDYIPFQLINNNCDLLDKLSTGQEVEVYFKIIGRESKQTKGTIMKDYFNMLQANNILIL